MFTIIIISFFAGILTVLSPCVLPLLPVILGWGLAGTDRKRPYIIIASLIVSLMLFTILLKASTLLIYIDPKFWDYVSGGVLIAFGITLIFPKLWTKIMIKTGIEGWSQKNLESSSQKEGIWWPIGMGAALGPVFSSCAPTYGLLLATILPLDIASGLVGLAFYFIGLWAILLLITVFGRKILGKFRFFANPNGAFRKILGVLVLLIGVVVITGTVKKIQTWVVENGNIPIVARIEEALNNKIDTSNLQQDDMMCASGKCSPQWQSESDVAMDILQAPEIRNIAHWINSDPLLLSSLRGKVVLIDFWTYSCINCIRTQPFLNAWHEKYEKDGLVIIGLHAPEFAFEKLEKNVREAVINANIKYAVAMDNNFSTWNAYGNRYWPAKYLIDQNGNIVYKHFGEGNYEETEKKIQELLWANSELEKEVQKTETPITPETYLGLSRSKNAVFAEWELQSGIREFKPSLNLDLNQWTLGWHWDVKNEFLEASEPSQITLRFSARKIFLVVSSNVERKWGMLFVQVLDREGKVISEKNVRVVEDDIYTVFDSVKFETDQTIRISATPGLRLHAFTFWW